jgi:hypothetical protein
MTKKKKKMKKVKIYAKAYKEKYYPTVSSSDSASSL